MNTKLAISAVNKIVNLVIKALSYLKIKNIFVTFGN